MAGTSASHCSNCGQRIVGNSYRIDGEVLCESCYQQAVEAHRKLQQEKTELYDYLKKLFSVDECPDSVKIGIDRALKDGKKLPAIRYTIYFYYEIQAHEPTDIGLVTWVIMAQYEAARAYAGEVRRIAEHNFQAQIETRPTTYEIAPPRRRGNFSRIQIGGLKGGNK